MTGVQTCALPIYRAELIDLLRADLGLSPAVLPARRMATARDLLDFTLAELDAGPRPPPDFPYGFERLLRVAQTFYPRAPASFDVVPEADRELREELLARWPDATKAVEVVATILSPQSLRTATALGLWLDAIREAHKLGVRDDLVTLAALAAKETH